MTGRQHLARLDAEIQEHLERETQDLVDAGLSSLLYEVTPTDVVTYSAVTILMIVTSAVACFAPAVRAASVDPLSALRTE